MTNKINTRQKGNIAEEKACEYLINQNFLIVERNYQKKWGELDIIGVKNGKIHFFEVKSQMFKWNERGYRPEENVHNLKIHKLRRIIQTYLNEKNLSETEFYFHIIAVSFDEKNSKYDIKLLENIIL